MARRNESSDNFSDTENVTINQRPSYPTNKLTVSLPDFVSGGKRRGGVIYCNFNLAVNSSFRLELRLEDSQR